MLHALICWGLLLGGVLGVVVTRTQLAQAGRAPLGPFSVQLPAAGVQAWKSIPAYHNTVPVLVYHGIGLRRSYLTVSRTLFAEQMAGLKTAGFHTLTIQQYVAFKRGDTAHLPSKPILLTFDDGRLDAYRAANAILKADGFHATEVVVPQWVTSNPRFSVNWSEINSMVRSGIWDIVEHFGYGTEGIQINAAGQTGGAFGDLEYFPGKNGKAGHQESFAQFEWRFISNMLWGKEQLKSHVPGYQSLAMAIPRSDYGQASTNDPSIPPFVISWLDSHMPVVFGGDYLDIAPGRPYEFEGRKNRIVQQISYRMTMGPQEILPVFRCRLVNWVLDRPIWWEYSCLRLAKSRSSSPQDAGQSTHGARLFIDWVPHLNAVGSDGRRPAEWAVSGSGLRPNAACIPDAIGATTTETHHRWPVPEIARRKSTAIPRVADVVFSWKPPTKGSIAFAARTMSVAVADAPAGLVLKVAMSTADGLAACAWCALAATKLRSSGMSSSIGAH